MFQPRRAPLAVRGVERETPMQCHEHDHRGEGTPTTYPCRRGMACRTLGRPHVPGQGPKHGFQAVKKSGGSRHLVESRQACAEALTTRQQTAGRPERHSPRATGERFVLGWPMSLPEAGTLFITRGGEGRLGGLCCCSPLIFTRQWLFDFGWWCVVLL